jgi:hypothetical protein
MLDILRREQTDLVVASRYLASGAAEMQYYGPDQRLFHDADDCRKRPRLRSQG